MDADQVGAAAEVFSAIGTVGTFTLAMVLLRKEQHREEARSADARRGQAVKVSAWVDAHRTPQGGREVRFHVHNASDMPIYEVSLMNPEAEADDDHEAEFIGLVPPGATVQRPAPASWSAAFFSAEPVEIEFRDSGGSQWRRDEQGALVLAEPRTQPRS